jgi:hypothetical protein
MVIHVLDSTKGEVKVNSDIGSHTPCFSLNNDYVIENIEGSEPEFLNFERARESILRNQFRQPSTHGGPVR